jgi:hypothetical protein
VSCSFPSSSLLSVASRRLRVDDGQLFPNPVREGLPTTRRVAGPSQYKRVSGHNVRFVFVSTQSRNVRFQGLLQGCSAGTWYLGLLWFLGCGTPRRFGTGAQVQTCFCCISCNTFKRSRSRWLKAIRSVSMGPSAIHGSGQRRRRRQPGFQRCRFGSLRHSVSWDCTVLKSAGYGLCMDDGLCGSYPSTLDRTITSGLPTIQELSHHSSNRNKEYGGFLFSALHHHATERPESLR